MFFFFFFFFFLIKDYERLCRTINSITETPQQIKLLWGIIIKRYRNSPDNINSSMITKVWKELCMDKKYSNVCHIESGFSDKIERTLGDYSRRIKSKQLNSKTAKTNQNINNIKNNVSPNSTSEINYSNVIKNNDQINKKNKNLPYIDTTKSTIVYLTSVHTPISANSNIITPSTPINVNNCNYTNFNNVMNNNINNVVPNNINNTVNINNAVPNNINNTVNTNNAVNNNINNTVNINNAVNNNINNVNINNAVNNNISNTININNAVINNNNQHFNYTYFNNQIPSPVPSTVISPIPVNDNSISSQVPTTIISPISINDNSIPSPVPTIVSPTITVPENTVSYKNNFSSQNNIQLATITTTAPTNEICYIPTYQPQYVFCNDQNQVQNIIIY